MPLYKATIVPRGNSLGMVQQLPEDDQLSVTKKEMRARMIVAMGTCAKKMGTHPPLSLLQVGGTLTFFFPPFFPSSSSPCLLPFFFFTFS